MRVVYSSRGTEFASFLPAMSLTEFGHTENFLTAFLFSFYLQWQLSSEMRCWFTDVVICLTHRDSCIPHALKNMYTEYGILANEQSKAEEGDVLFRARDTARIQHVTDAVQLLATTRTMLPNWDGSRRLTCCHRRQRTCYRNKKASAAHQSHPTPTTSAVVSTKVAGEEVLGADWRRSCPSFAATSPPPPGVSLSPPAHESGKWQRPDMWLHILGPRGTSMAEAFSHRCFFPDSNSGSTTGRKFSSLFVLDGCSARSGRTKVVREVQNIKL